MFTVNNTIKLMGVARRLPTFSGCYARGKEYGLNKRVDVIRLNIIIAIQEIPDVPF
jgi:hypothetical protein